MKITLQIIRALVLSILIFGRFIASTMAQDISIPDPGLDAAIRETLQKPVGPLTGLDMSGLTNLDACCRSITSLAGLEA